MSWGDVAKKTRPRHWNQRSQNHSDGAKEASIHSRSRILAVAAEVSMLISVRKGEIMPLCCWFPCKLCEVESPPIALTHFFSTPKTLQRPARLDPHAQAAHL